MANAQQVRPMTNSSDEVNLVIDDSQQVRQLEQVDQQPPILVLSRDGELVETVRKAAPRGTRVTHAPDLDHVAEKLPNLRPGVLVADTASAPDIPSMVAQLTQHFPELVRSRVRFPAGASRGSDDSIGRVPVFQTGGAGSIPAHCMTDRRRNSSAGRAPFS